jgi:hypothetical protein
MPRPVFVQSSFHQCRRPILPLARFPVCWLLFLLQLPPLLIVFLLQLLRPLLVLLLQLLPRRVSRPLFIQLHVLLAVLIPSI